MAQRVVLGAPRQQEGQRHIAAAARDVSRGVGALVATAFLAVACVLTLGARNGMFASGAQAEAQFKHEIFPVAIARKGFMEPLETENRSRRQMSQRTLDVPKDRHQRFAEQRSKLNDLQLKLSPERSR